MFLTICLPTQTSPTRAPCRPTWSPCIPAWNWWTCTPTGARCSPFATRKTQNRLRVSFRCCRPWASACWACRWGMLPSGTRRMAKSARPLSKAFSSSLRPRATTSRSRQPRRNPSAARQGPRSPAAPPPDAGVRLSHHALQLRQRHGIHVHAATRIDFTAADVAREAAGADLVVWGTAPLRGLRAWFSAQPAIQMLRACQRPVIVVRNPADQPYQTLMVAVDFSRVSHRLVELAFALHPTARVELFHAISTANEGKLRYAEVSERTIQIYREECRRHAQDRMFTLTDSYDARRNRLSSSIGRGDPARQVVVQQQNTAADLIVVGKHPASRLSDLLFESVAQRVVRDALADVLVVPNDFQPASRGSAVKRLATDLPVRRV